MCVASRIPGNYCCTANQLLNDLPLAYLKHMTKYPELLTLEILFHVIIKACRHYHFILPDPQIYNLF